jgi:dTDP-4-amino-4,6-dideoxygalactose transaminase
MLENNLPSDQAQCEGEKPSARRDVLRRLADRITLIPRNNWDYGLKALLGALAGVRHHVTQASNTETIFLQTPIWTKSGRTSLYAILKSLGLTPGAKVGVPLFCCPVVFDAICQAGLSPRFLDSNLSDCNLSVEDLFKKRTELAAVVVVHMFGKPCDMDAILAVADTMPVIEDCAQSVFSTYKGRQTGLLSTASFFSFRCGKYLSAGEGSAIFCRDPELADRIERIVDSFERWSTPHLLSDALLTFVKATLYHRPWYGLIGYPVGTRLDRKLNLTAKEGFEAAKIASTHLALIEARIPRFQEKIDIQTAHAHRLLEALVPGSFGLPSEGNGCSSNWFQFALRFQTTDQRDAMADYLFHHGIDTSKYADTVPEEAASSYSYAGDCPNAERLSQTVLLVPIHYTLGTRDIEHIACSINEGSRRI